MDAGWKDVIPRATNVEGVGHKVLKHGTVWRPAPFSDGY